MGLLGDSNDFPTAGAGEATPGAEEETEENLELGDLELEGQGEPGEPVVEIDGQQVPLSEIRRWRDTRKNLEADFTKKYQSLAEQRKQIEPLINWFRSNPHQAQILAAVIDGQITPAQAAQFLALQQVQAAPDSRTAPTGQLPPAVLDELNQMKQLLMRQLEAQADAEIEATLEELKERAQAEGLEWTEEFEQAILQTAYDNNITDLEHVYEALAYRRLKDQIAAAKKQGEQETIRNLQQKRQQAGNILGGQQRGGAAPPKAIKDFKDATNAALSDEALMKSLFVE